MSVKDIYRAFLFLLSLIFLVFITLCCIFGFQIFAGAKVSFKFSESGEFDIFIGGYVENEGYYAVRYSDTYGELFENSGVLNVEGILADNSLIKLNEAVNPYEEFVICNYPGFKNQNINYAATEKLQGCGLSLESAQKIRNYIDEQGPFTDKLDLVRLSIITKEEYEVIKFKIYAYVI